MPGKRVMQIITRKCVGGATTYVLDLTDSLLTGHDVLLVSGKVGADERQHPGGHQIPEVHISALRREISFVHDLKAFFAIWRLIRQWKPDLVHTHTSKAGIIGRMAAWLGGVPTIVHTYHGLVFEGHFGPLKSRLYRLVETALCRITDAVIVLSEVQKRDLCQRFRVALAEQTHVLPLGIKAELFQGRDGKLRTQIAGAGHLPLVGMVARLESVKNYELFLRVARYVKDRMDARFVCIGDGPLRTNLEVVAGSLGISDSVVFLGARADVPDLLPDLDVVMLTSHSEGTPLVLMEAMAAGKPVVATRVGGIPDVVEEGITGFLGTTRDELGAHVMNLLRRADIRREMGRKGQQRVSSMFESRTAMARVDELYEVLQGKAPLGYRLIKRVIDIIGAGLAIVLLSPLFLVVPVLIRFDSPGSILFRQQRAGYRGRPFQMIKFRTMVPNAELRLRDLLDVDSLKEPVFKLKDDPRVTKVGAFLRRTSLDELPQFFNVIKGDMSLVGPRPEEVWLVERYNADQRQRLQAKPGITGPMQVGGRGELSLTERVALEVDYIRHPSIWRDIKLILLTIPAVLLRKGAM